MYDDIVFVCVNCYGNYLKYIVCSYLLYYSKTSMLQNLQL